MSPTPGRPLVVLGMLTRIPLAGIVWLTLQYVLGFRRLGYDVYYVEAHGRTPRMLMPPDAEDDGADRAAAYLEGVMRRFDLSDRWAYQALHADGRCYGLDRDRLRAVYRSAELLINLHGGTTPLPEHRETGRLVYVGTDPVLVEIELSQGIQKTIDFLDAHCAIFTWGENHGNADCKLPVSERFTFKPTRQPVLLDQWTSDVGGSSDAFTTVGNWRQPWREVVFEGETYRWSKHEEFLKFLDLPARTSQPFELALSSYTAEDAHLLREKGWRVCDALGFSLDADCYREYVVRSRGEFTVAKDQNVRLRSGWFSDRSATYLAAGRPVITQETGFSNVLPTGRGLFAFSTLDEIVEATERVNADYALHARAARDVAREYFDSDVVLRRLLADVGL